MDRKRFAIIGNGYLCGIITDAYNRGYLPDYELAAVLGRSREKTAAAARKAGCTAVYSMAELLAAKPDIIVEAASVAAVREYIIEVLERGISFVTLSIGAFADDEFYRQAKHTAAASGAKIYIASGAIGGFDVMRTISLMSNPKAEFIMSKTPSEIKETALYDESMAELKQRTLAFEGSAKEVIELMPTKINVGVAAALATVGAENMNVKFYCDPDVKEDDIRIKVSSDEAYADINIVSKPTPITAWSIVALLNNIVSPVVF